MAEPSRVLTPSRTLPWVEAAQISNPVYADLDGQAMVTFSYDDGLMNQYEEALPLHEEYGVPLTLHIIARYVADTDSRYFSPWHAKDADRRGAEISSHSYYHDDWLTNKTDSEVAFEFLESKRVLSKAADRVETFAVPFSQYDASVKAIGDNHYQAIRVHGNTDETIPPDDRFWLRSRSITNETTYADVKGWIDGAVTAGEWLIIMLHGIADPNDNQYEMTPTVLGEVLAYVNSLGRETILPVNMRDGIRFALGLGDF